MQNPCPGFEIRLTVPFPTTIVITPWAVGGYIFEWEYKKIYPYKYYNLSHDLCVYAVRLYIWVHLGSISSLMHISLNNIDVLFTYFCICPFQSLKWFYSIRWELVDETLITNCYSSTFCPILGHHQGCVYCESDVTFACKLLFCKCLLFILVCCCSDLFVYSCL